MPFKITILLGFLLVLAAFLSAAWFYPSFAFAVPMHLDTSGHMQGQLRHVWAAFLLPIIMLAVWLALSLLALIAPPRYRPDSSSGVYGSIYLAILAMLLIGNLFKLLAPNGKHLAMQHLIPIIVGLLLIISGNYLGKLRTGFIAGIRTPWSLANAEVWARTHRLSGYVFVIAGFVLMVAGLRAPSQSVPYILGAIFVLLMVVSYGSSYFFNWHLHTSHKSRTL